MQQSAAAVLPMRGAQRAHARESTFLAMHACIQSRNHANNTTCRHPQLTHKLQLVVQRCAHTAAANAPLLLHTACGGITAESHSHLAAVRAAAAIQVQQLVVQSKSVQRQPMTKRTSARPAAAQRAAATQQHKQPSGMAARTDAAGRLLNCAHNARKRTQPGVPLHQPHSSGVVAYATCRQTHSPPKPLRLVAHPSTPTKPRALCSFGAASDDQCAQARP